MQIISQNYVVWNRANEWIFSNWYKLQIISQNYVVWNNFFNSNLRGLSGCKLYHKTTWFETCKSCIFRTFDDKLQIISQNYVVWNRRSWRTEFVRDYIANYITKLRGLKPKYNKKLNCRKFCCKLYHKTTWFETK